MSEVTPLTPVEEIQQQQQAASENWIRRCLVALDQFVNVTVFRGQPNETISTHCGRACVEGKLWGKALAGFLNWFEPDHCSKARAGDIQRCLNLIRIENSWDNPA